jgi:hypothetical protein
MSAGITPNLSPEAMQELTRYVRVQGGRPIERKHDPKPLDYEGQTDAETCGCGQQRLFHVVFEDGGAMKRNLIGCADCDAMGRWPRWLRPESMSAPPPSGP